MKEKVYTLYKNPNKIFLQNLRNEYNKLVVGKKEPHD